MHKVTYDAVRRRLLEGMGAAAEGQHPPAKAAPAGTAARDAAYWYYKCKRKLREITWKRRGG